jgi:hypothetical protein
VGDSQIFLAVKPGKGAADERFPVMTSKTGNQASMSVETGHLASSDSPALEAACRRLIGTNKRSLEIDLRNLDYMPTSTIEVVGKISAEAEAGGSRLLVLCTQELAKAFRLVVGKNVAIKIGGKPPGGALRSR